jgi:hypothetical protein
MDFEPQPQITNEPSENSNVEVNKPSRKNIFWIIGAVLIIAVLAGGAFMAMRLLNAKTPDTAGGDLGGGGSLGLHVTGGSVPGAAPSGGKSVSIKMIPSKDLPQQKADISGMVVKTQDNSLFVGEMTSMMVSSINGKISTSPTPAGPYMEVVVSKETKIYRDVTMNSLPDPSKVSGNSFEVEQKLDAGALSDVVAGNSNIQVWGQKRGDRLIADIVVVQGIGVIKGSPATK